MPYTTPAPLRMAAWAIRLRAHSPTGGGEACRKAAETAVECLACRGAAGLPA